MKKKDAIEIFGSYWSVWFNPTKLQSKRKFIRGDDPSEWKIYIIENLGSIDDANKDDIGVCFKTWDEAISFVCQEMLSKLDSCKEAMDAIALNAYRKNTWDDLDSARGISNFLRRWFVQTLNSRHKIIADECTLLNKQINKIKQYAARNELKDKLPDILNEFFISPLEDDINMPHTIYGLKENTKVYLVYVPQYLDDIDKFSISTCQLISWRIKETSIRIFGEEKSAEYDVHYYFKNENNGSIITINHNRLHELLTGIVKYHSFTRLGWFLFPSKDKASSYIALEKSQLMENINVKNAITEMHIGNCDQNLVVDEPTMSAALKLLNDMSQLSILTPRIFSHGGDAIVFTWKFNGRQKFITVDEDYACVLDKDDQGNILSESIIKLKDTQGIEEILNSIKKCGKTFN